VGNLLFDLFVADCMRTRSGSKDEWGKRVEGVDVFYKVRVSSTAAATPPYTMDDYSSLSHSLAHSFPLIS
jgi:hypothetical protein